MAAVSADFISTAVGRVQVRRGGDGDPLVYLHSAAGEGEGLALLDELATRHSVIAPMFPGFGESEGIEQINDMEDVAFHLLDLFDRLELAAPAVMGLSLGAWMAAELATRYPDRISRLILVNPVGLYIKGAEIKDIFGRSPADMAGDLFADQSHPMAQLMLQMDRMLADGRALASIPFELVRPQVQALAATARLAWNPYLHNPKLRNRLGRVSSPTIIVRGAQDTLVPAAHSQSYAEEIKGAKLIEVQNAAHLISVERPAELAAIANDFLTQ